MKRSFSWVVFALILAGAHYVRAAEVYIVPNFHPASCGWLTNWSLERNYCANSYLNHLERVGADPNYTFAISECNNMIAIRNFQPERFEELKRRIAEGRVEPVNAFFLEPTICLSGGEALVKMGVEGLRWQQAFLGVRPRFCWAIDVCGTHAQMPQICKGLGLEALVMCRPNTTGKTIFWYESADGTRVLTLMPGHYSDFGPVFGTTGTLTQKDLAALKKNIEAKEKITPAGAPILVLGGSRDYSLAPVNKANPTEFLGQWKTFAPETTVRFATLANYVDALKPQVEKLNLPTMRGEGGYFFNSFWIQNPRVKAWYRKCEHELQSAEALAAIASLVRAGTVTNHYEYPSEALYQAWILMCLNMDRNTLWGAAGGMVFEHPESWDAKDRFQWVDKTCNEISGLAGRAFLGEGGDGIGLFNSANWGRRDPQALTLPAGRKVAGVACQKLEDGRVLCQPELPSMGVAGWKLSNTPVEEPKKIALPKIIENPYYIAQVDPEEGDLASLKVKPSLREVLGGPANRVVYEKGVYKGDPGDHAQDRTQRAPISVDGGKMSVAAWEGPVAITVQASDGRTQRRMRFYKNSPRIDFETELNDVPDRTIVVAEFPLAEAPLEIRRGVPYGFSRGAWSKPNPALPGWTKGIVPAVRWSDYTFEGGAGLAILDRGCPGREIEDKKPVIYLLNATDKYYGYPNDWLSGKGVHNLEYAVVAHDGPWEGARIPQTAWEYNCPAVAWNWGEVVPRSFVQTSDNVIIEAMRREDGQIELRMAECLGEAGEAWVRVDLPHQGAALTDMTGSGAQPLKALQGERYSFPVRPQQIVTMRLAADRAVAGIKPLDRWDELVPESKRAALNRYVPELKGHPPRGN